MELEELPESWQTEVKRLRQEAANYRTKYQDVNKKLPEYETALADANARFDHLSSQAAAAEDAREKALVDHEQAMLEVARRDAAIAAGIPTYAHRLAGDTPEALVEDAKRFAEELGSRAPSKDFAAGQPAGEGPKVGGLQAIIDQKLGFSE